ncbi:hypothetical protein ml_470 [Mollivirus sibericum]|uniref:hypothetical protein n=1 Tax=Mollivirus sibericum TaxID=1678078 RepID=UPI0006B2E07C|nr:hypothetical protein ml_470 [Mollivirus sibericum]ALD62272.1 hypothetical protein ml_470 [Mollivirus sibericum]
MKRKINPHAVDSNPDLAPHGANPLLCTDITMIITRFLDPYDFVRLTTASRDLNSLRHCHHHLRALLSTCSCVDPSLVTIALQLEDTAFSLSVAELDVCMRACPALSPGDHHLDSEPDRGVCLYAKRASSRLARILLSRSRHAELDRAIDFALQAMERSIYLLKASPSAPPPAGQFGPWHRSKRRRRPSGSESSDSGGLEHIQGLRQCSLVSALAVECCSVRDLSPLPMQAVFDHMLHCERHGPKLASQLGATERPSLVFALDCLEIFIYDIEQDKPLGDMFDPLLAFYKQHFVRPQYESAWADVFDSCLEVVTRCAAYLESFLCSPCDTTDRSTLRRHNHSLKIATICATMFNHVINSSQWDTKKTSVIASLLGRVADKCDGQCGQTMDSISVTMETHVQQ